MPKPPSGAAKASAGAEAASWASSASGASTRAEAPSGASPCGGKAHGAAYARWLWLGTKGEGKAFHAC